MADANTALIKQTFFSVKMRKEGERLLVTDPLTVKNQINELPINRLETLNDVSIVEKITGSTVVYNSNTQTYEIKPLDYLPPLVTVTVETLNVSTITVGGVAGSNDQILLVSNDTLVWANLTSLTVNNSILLNGQPAEYYTNASNLTTGSIDPTLILSVDGGFY